MSNSSKPIKFAYLRKLAYQSTLNGAYMIEITKACKVAFMKATTFLVVRFKGKGVNSEKTENGENIFLKAVANRFRLTSKLT